MIEPVRKSIEVRCEPETAFRIFTSGIADWWPVDRHSISSMRGENPASIALEPHVGGQVFEITADGRRENWARITHFEPGRKIALNWHVMVPEDQATTVEVLFLPISGGTRVELVHSGWEILGESGAQMRNNYNGGWVGVFETAFAEACANARMPAG